MIDILSRSVATLACVVIVVSVASLTALAQQPTDEQRSAIRSACRADYQANCASVPPGGMASLQCLQKNMASLSAVCQRAVSAIEPAAAAPKAEVAPTPSAPAATAPAATKTTSTPAVPPKAAVNAPANISKPVSTAKGAPSAPTAAKATASVAASSPAAAAAEAPVPPMVLRPMRPREELFVVRSACSGDARAVCGTVQAGGGRIVQCLAANAPALSPACKEVLGQFAAQ